MSQKSWVQFQHPPTEWNLRGGRWSSVEKRALKRKIPYKKNIYPAISYDTCFVAVIVPCCVSSTVQYILGLRNAIDLPYLVKYQEDRINPRINWRITKRITNEYSWISRRTLCWSVSPPHIPPHPSPTLPLSLWYSSPSAPRTTTKNINCQPRTIPIKKGVGVLVTYSQYG